MEAFIFITLLVIFYIIPIAMADNRGRSMAGWFLITLIVSPFWAIIALLVLGEAKE